MTINHVTQKWIKQMRNNMSDIQDYGFLRIGQIIGNPEKGIKPIIPLSRTAFLKGVREGRFPKPVKLTPRSSAWRAADIRALCEKLGAA